MDPERPTETPQDAVVSHVLGAARRVESRWPIRSVALGSTTLLVIGTYYDGQVASTLMLCGLLGTIGGVTLGVMARRHAVTNFRAGDSLYIVLSVLLTIYGGTIVLMAYAFKDGGVH